MKTNEQQSLSTQYLTHFPANITIGQRREAIRRLFLHRLQWAVHDQKHPEGYNVTYKTDCWLENAIGETVVRAYALGMIHGVEGAKSETSGPNLIITNHDPIEMVAVKDALGEPADLRPCDLQIEFLHQVLREALPMWNDTTIIDKVREAHRREMETMQAKRQSLETTTKS